MGEPEAAEARWFEEVVGLIVLVVVVNAIGAAPSLLAGPSSAWFEGLTKPAIYPPPVTFGVVWTLLFTFQAAATWLVIRGSEGPDRLSALALFGAQFFVALAWTPTFFGLRNVDWGLAVIAGAVALAAITARTYGRIDRRAGLLLVPYLAWLAFAGVLNYQFLVLN
jgi:benzodiazapine receptor